MFTSFVAYTRSNAPYSGESRVEKGETLLPAHHFVRMAGKSRPERKVPRFFPSRFEDKSPRLPGKLGFFGDCVPEWLPTLFALFFVIVVGMCGCVCRYRRLFSSQVVQFGVCEGEMEDLVNGRWVLAGWKNEAVGVALKVIDELCNGRRLACFGNDLVKWTFRTKFPSV